MGQKMSLKDRLSNINPYYKQEIILLHTKCHIYNTVPKYNPTSQTKRNHIYCWKMDAREKCLC